MKVELEKHISKIFSSLQIIVSFKVYDCHKDILPEWTKQIRLTHEFLVCCENTIEAKRKKLQIFLRKNIFEVGDHIYWFDGTEARTIVTELTKRETPIEVTEQKIDYLKTKTTLPTWLDNFIFNQLNAIYAPDFQRFAYNLDLTREDNLKYLGTYFPRSYSESFCIFDNIFQNENYQITFRKKKSLNILSVGCGVGGDLIGLLTVIEKYCPQVSEINVWALDGNEEALGILARIVEKFKVQFLKKINLNNVKHIFDSISHIDIQQVNKQTFDFILTFKMICEIISAGKGFYDNSYYDFVIKFMPSLSKEGLCLLLDVTIKEERLNTFNPILMNGQINQALLKLKDFQTLLPLPCNQYEKKCLKQCFTQQKFYISHRQKTNDISKVSYRVMGKTTFVNTLADNRETAKYIIQKDKQEIAICPYSYEGKIIDGYKLKTKRNYA